MRLEDADVLPELEKEMQSRLIRRAFLWAAVGVVLAVLSGCLRESAAPPGPTVNRDPNVVVVYVACGVLPAVEAAAERFEQARAGKSVEIRAGVPGELADLIRGGDVPDLLVCIGDAEIGALEREGLVARTPVAAPMEFRLVIVTPAEVGTLKVRSHRDLASRAVEAIAMPSPGITSLGSDAADALKRLAVWDDLQESLKITETPLEALELAAAGKVDVAIIYQPCPALGLASRVPRDALVVVAPLEPDSERRTSLHAGLHKSSPNAPLARLFLRYLKAGGGTAQETEGAPETEAPGAAAPEGEPAGEAPEAASRE